MEKRNWTNQTPGDLAKSIILESAELLEHFQWDESSIASKQLKDQEKIALEAADIFIYLYLFCQRSNINLLETVNKKLIKLEEKYPAGIKISTKKYREIKEEYRNNG